MKSNELEDFMSFYNREYIIFIGLFLIVCISTIRTISDFRHHKSPRFTDLLITILAGIGFLGGIVFQGILSDYSVTLSGLYLPKTMMLASISLFLFIIQLVVYILNVREQRRWNFFS